MIWTRGWACTAESRSDNSGWIWSQRRATGGRSKSRHATRSRSGSSDLEACRRKHATSCWHRLGTCSEAEAEAKSKSQTGRKDHVRC